MTDFYGSEQKGRECCNHFGTKEDYEYVQHEFEKTIKGFSVHGEIFYSCGEENGFGLKMQLTFCIC